MNLSNLFDDETKQRLIDLYAGPKPTREEWLAQLERWRKECNIVHTPAEIAQIAADQARRIKCMKDG